MSAGAEGRAAGDDGVAGPPAAGGGRIAAIALDERSIVRWSPEVEHERDVAIFDLLEANSFRLLDGPPGPYRVRLALREGTLHLELDCEATGGRAEVTLPVRPLRQVVKDYFLICGSYFEAIKGASPARVEAVDMARRGLHDEGSELLAEVLGGKVECDRNTARRLFTLVCVLHLRA